MEIWKPVVGFEGLYEVSSLGRLSSTRRRGAPGGLVKFDYDHNGYAMYKLSKRGQKRKNKYIHHMVLEAFVGPMPTDMEACHFDGDRTNNNVENLRWDTHHSNVLDFHSRKR